MLGIGAIEVMPRKVLMLYDDADEELGLVLNYIHRNATMPLNYLGYVAEYAEVKSGLPSQVLAGRYAAVVTWFLGNGSGSALPAFLKRAIGEGLRIAMLGDFGLDRGEPLSQTLGLRAAEAKAPSARVTIDTQDPLIGFEMQPVIDRRGFFPLEASGGQPLLRLKNERGEIMDAAALTPWGGYVLSPYAMYVLPALKGQRWVIDPIEFFRRALALPDMPVPDVTTENGRRLMLVHVDGDGFPSRAELPGTPFAGEALLREVLARHPVPTTVSVIQGEVAANGLYPADSPALEKIARQIFALPYVEIASHSYSHPFRWGALEKSERGEGYSLAIPNYRFNAATEVDGSIDYINSTLAPAGKRTKVFLWTGDSDPGADTLALTYAKGVLNMNGGDTWITRAEPTLTLVSPIGIRKGRHFQVYAPNQNENLYTNLWTGPFYGFERVIETFQMTDSPRRLKPIDIYYHTYSATKRASLVALDRVYRWALAQRVLNIHVSEYVRKALDFNRMVVARSGQGWLVRGAGDLRELRLRAGAGFPDLDASRGVAGYSRHNGEHYIHLAGGETFVALAATAPRQPYLADANARLDRVDRVEHVGRDQGFAFTLTGAMPLEFSLGNVARCEVRSGNTVITPRAVSEGIGQFELKRDGTATITVRCPA